MQVLNLYGPINNLGYGVHFYNTARELVKLTDCTISPIGRTQLQGPIDTLIQQAIGRASEMKLDDPAVCFYHEFALQFFTGSPKIGFPVFETTILNTMGVNLLKQMDKILVPSRWGENILAENGIDGEIHVVPEGVDQEIFNPEVLANRTYEDPSRFTIISIGKFEERKGQSILLKVLEDHFSTRDLRVLGMWFNPFIQKFPEWQDQFLKKRGWTRVESVPNRGIYKYHNLRIEVIPPQPTAQTVASIMKCADLAVFPHRAEGWGLPIIECIACGIPTVATNYSGPTEFLRPTNSYPLTNFTMEIANDSVWFKGDRGYWATPNRDELRAAIEQGIAGKIPLDPSTVDQYSWKSAATKLIEAIK